MKRIALLFVIVCIAMLTTACGGSAPAATQAPVQSAVPAATQAPAQPAVADTPASSASGTVVTVTLADNTIKSSLTEFKAGMPYTFVINNTGHHAHNFNISTPVSIAGSLDAALSSALLAVDKEKLSVGASTTVTYTFPDSAVGAQLEFSCLIKKHYEDGMTLAITVTK